MRSFSGASVIALIFSAAFGAMLVAVLGTPANPAGELTAFRHGWIVVAAMALAAAAAATALRARPARAVGPAAQAIPASVPRD